MTDWANWLIGPQLLGILSLLIGFIQYRFPPRKINNYYGYRTATSQKNQETWDEANRYSAVFMMKCGIVVLVIGLVIALIFAQFNVPMKIRIALGVFLIIVSAMAPVILMMVATEKHLSKTFDEKQQ